MKTQLLFNGWWAHYTPNCWFKNSEDPQNLNEEGVMVGFRPKEEGLTMEEAYEKSKNEKHI